MIFFFVQILLYYMYNIIIIPIQEGLEPTHCAVIGNRSYLLGFLIDEYDTEPDAQTKVHVAI